MFAGINKIPYIAYFGSRAIESDIRAASPRRLPYGVMKTFSGGEHGKKHDDRYFNNEQSNGGKIISAVCFESEKAAYCSKAECGSNA
jgi:hypothetical protein